jgi:hypothetical protein
VLKDVEMNANVHPLVQVYAAHDAVNENEQMTLGRPETSSAADSRPQGPQRHPGMKQRS